jgi:CubicO group peptidase (beta-lactamase class C family)
MNHHLLHRSRRFILFVLLLFALVGLTGFSKMTLFPAQEGESRQSQAVREAKIDAGGLEAFTDATIQKQLEQYHIAGAMVSIVQDGQIELAKGYGYADVAKKTPVDPAETLFRMGSTSKLFTWTAVMQLAEQGKLDLNADVNTYLPDFQIPATFPEPITMLNLLSHTAGFEERATGTEVREAEDMISLHDYLARYMPDRIRPAGEMTAYSNYGNALAGYIVEAVSGMPFDRYVDAYIFAPLSMTHSSFLQPLPASLADHLAKSYSYQGGFLPGTFMYVNPYPAASLGSTAHDMANFMLAHLDQGKFGDNQILEPETVTLMHSHLFSNDERLDGLAYGFFEETLHGKRILWHSGDIGNYHSILALIPEENLGFFVGYNSAEGFPAVNEFYYSFMDAFFPSPESGNPPVSRMADPPPTSLAGEYRSTRSFYDHIERVTGFPGKGYLRVGINPDNSLSVAGQTFYQRDFLVYSPLDGSNTLIFHQDDSGNITHMLFNGYPLSGFERISWYESPAFNLDLFFVCYLLLLTAPLAALMRGIRRRHAAKNGSRLPRIARNWTVLVSAVFLLVPVIVEVYSAVDYKSPFPAYMVIALAVLLAASILAIGPLVFTVLAWVRGYWGKAARLHYTLVTLSLVGMTWLFYYWRLLGFRY